MKQIGNFQIDSKILLKNQQVKISKKTLRQDYNKQVPSLQSVKTYFKSTAIERAQFLSTSKHNTGTGNQKFRLSLISQRNEIELLLSNSERGLLNSDTPVILSCLGTCQFCTLLPSPHTCTFFPGNRAKSLFKNCIHRIY